MTRAQRIATSIAWQLGLGCLFVVLISAIHDTAQSARAADAASGKRLAQARCSLCHIVEPDQREELANSPPFETIARRSGFDADMLAYLILSPHPRMNMTLSRTESEDIAAYIATLQR
jgi:mono/diheme cytochrome c family protein